MDPLDQRLTDAGNAWREAQSEPPDLNQIIAALPRRRSGLFEGRFMYAFIAGLLLVAAIAVAPGVGGFLHQVTTPVPVPTAAPSPTPTDSQASGQPSPATPEPSPTAALGERETATALVDEYEAALVAGRYATAFDLLAPASLTCKAGFAAFQSERTAFFRSVAGQYTVLAPVAVTDWADYAPLVEGADQSRALLIEVDYPALAGNNAGFEQFVVAPDSGGTWRIWPVR